MRFIFFLACCLVSIYLGGQPYGFLTWSVEDGLPQSQVTALAEDERGYLWVGTNGGGVARFDGADFEVFTTGDGLRDNFVRALSIDEAGTVYALTRLGLSTLHPDSVRFKIQGITGAEALFQGAAAGAMQRVSQRYQEASQELTYYLDSRPFTLKRTSNDRWEEVPTTDTANPPESSPYLKMRNGNRLRGTREQGLYLLNARGEPLDHYTEGNGDLPHNTILALLEDRQNRYWIGTSGGGLVRMIPSGLRHYDAGDGLAGNRVYALHAGKDGKLWIGVSQRGIQYRDETGFHELPGEDPTRGSKITSITEDGGGRIYFATDGRGITVLDSAKLIQISGLQSYIASNYILKLLPAGENSIHAVSYDQGVDRIFYYPDKDSFDVRGYAMVEIAETLSFSSAIQGSDSTLLLGSTNGLVQWYDYTMRDSFVVFGENEGLPPGRISAMALRRKTQLWVAVLGYGVYYTDLRMPEPRFYPLPNRFRDLSTNIFQITVDPNESALWLGTERGVTRLYLNRDGQPDYAQHYGRAEGFLGGETTRDGSTIDSLGRIWFGTLNGLVRYEEDRGDTYLAPPPTYLDRVNLFYGPVETKDYRMVNKVPTFAAANNHFQFRFAAVDLTYPDRLRYRFRLRGEEEDWSPLTDERAVRYAGLDAGRYTFEVEATTDGGRTFGKSAEYTFAITSPLVRSGTFLGLVALLAAILVIGVSYYFFRRVQRKEALLREELETQKRLLELEQKARQLQMNPHFIFNALNGIRGLVDGEHDAEARQQITKFATLMRGILNNSRQEAITLEEEVKVLREYIDMERFCQNFPIDYTINVPENIDPEEVSLPPMLLQPFVENAILHGLAGKENGGTITISFFLRGRGMQCLVEDDGVGRKVAGERQTARGTPHRSVAVDVTRERLQSSGGKLTISDRTGGGTVVEVIVPVEMW